MITITIKGTDDGMNITTEGVNVTNLEDDLCECAVKAAADKLNSLLAEAGIKATHTTESVKVPA